MGEWKSAKLSDIAEVQTGPFGSQLKNEQYITGGTPVITVEHISSFRIVDFNYPSVTEEDKIRLSKYLLRTGDIVFTRVGSVDLSALVKPHQNGWMFSSRMLRVRPFDAVDSKYLSYFFQQQSFRDFILNISVGATMPSINTEILKDVQISFPPLLEQRAIASVLSSLDDKIDLLHRQNKTLEGMAETLFRQWFVEEADENRVGMHLGDLLYVKHGYAFKGSYITDEETENILVTPGNFKIGGGFKDDKLKYYSKDFPEEYILNENDLIVTMTDLSKDCDTLGYPAFVPKILNKNLLHNQRIGKIVFKKEENIKYNYFLYFIMKTAEYRDHILGSASGTSIMHTSPERICKYKCILPNQEDLLNYNRIVSSHFNKIAVNNKQVLILERLRNNLLPKLINGEVDIDF